MSNDLKAGKTINVPCIPMRKGYVRGYYEKRDGRLVWISPYENSKTRNGGDDSSEVTALDGAVKQVKKPDSKGSTGYRTKPTDLSQNDRLAFNYILDIIIKIVETISNFEPGEVVRLQYALRMCRSIISELGYYDESISGFFRIPKAKATRLDRKASRQTAAMTKETKRLYRRIVRHTLKEKVQKLSMLLEEAL